MKSHLVQPCAQTRGRGKLAVTKMTEKKRRGAIRWNQELQSLVKLDEEDEENGVSKFQRLAATALYQQQPAHFPRKVPLHSFVLLRKVKREKDSSADSITSKADPQSGRARTSKTAPSEGRLDASAGVRKPRSARCFRDVMHFGALVHNQSLHGPIPCSCAPCSSAAAKREPPFWLWIPVGLGHHQLHEQHQPLPSNSVNTPISTLHSQWDFDS